jgi:hypothetical protein
MAKCGQIPDMVSSALGNGLGKFFTAAETCGGAVSAIDAEEKGYKMEINEKKGMHACIIDYSTR